MIGQVSCGVGGADAASLLFEQGQAGLLREGGHVLADRRWGVAEVPCGSVDGPCGQDCAQDGEASRVEHGVNSKAGPNGGPYLFACYEACVG